MDIGNKITSSKITLPLWEAGWTWYKQGSIHYYCDHIIVYHDLSCLPMMAWWSLSPGQTWHWFQHQTCQYLPYMMDDQAKERWQYFHIWNAPPCCRYGYAGLEGIVSDEPIHLVSDPTQPLLCRYLQYLLACFVFLTQANNMIISCHLDMTYFISNL